MKNIEVPVAIFAGFESLILAQTADLLPFSRFKDTVYLRAGRRSGCVQEMLADVAVTNDAEITGIRGTSMLSNFASIIFLHTSHLSLYQH